MRQRRHHFANRHNRESATWDQLEPLAAPPLSAAEIQAKRLELAADMVQLVLQDAVDLAAGERRTLRKLSEALEGFKHQGRW